MIKYDQKFLVFDSETDGLNLKYNKPWEISYVEACGKKILSRRQIYFELPHLKISRFIKQLTGFNQKKFDENKISPEEAWKAIKEFIYDDSYMLIGQNILHFDVWMLNYLCLYVDKKPLDFSIIDRILDTRYLGLAYKNELEVPRAGRSLVDWFYKIHADRSIKGRVTQLALLKDLGIEFEKEKLHDGLYDCEKSWEIFVELKKGLKL